jgi:uncharacterized protein
MEIEISGLTLLPGQHEEVLRDKVAVLLEVSPETIQALKVIRKSLDARRKPLRFAYTIGVVLMDPGAATEKPGPGVVIRPARERVVPSFHAVPFRPAKRPVIIGCGPAGLFAALTLAERGVESLLLERGKSVPERISDVDRLWRQGIFNPESHVHFGEGGAGTFSDGKLTSRAKNPYTGWVKEILVEMGAPTDILTDAKPHIGTDRLRAVVIHLRRCLMDRGCEVRFGAKATDLIIDGNRLAGLVVNNVEEITTDHVILAPGQSADDTYGRLVQRGVCIRPKPFAMGLRVEHPQELIDRIQYGESSRRLELPPADYFLTAKISNPDRSVYTFCMCPGGQIIGCPSEAGGVIVNGMSSSRRDGLYANSAVVVNIRPDDFASDEPLSGLAFRRIWEAKAFAAGGGKYHAPAQRVSDFVEDREAGDVGATSYLPGVKAAGLKHVLPDFAVASLRQGLRQFNRKMPGFVTGEAHLIGVETRTSSPVRILRGLDGQSVTIAGLYPCGEGAGYAGGIISSALDGVRAALHLE